MSLPNDQRTVQDSDGNEIPFADIEVRDLAGGLVTIYSDSDGTTEITQPGFQSDANGFYRFYAQPGYYEITVTGPEGARVLARVNLERGVTSIPDIASLSSLNTAALVDGQQFSRARVFWPDVEAGDDGKLVWRSGVSKTEHDGIFTIDPDRVSELDAVTKAYNGYFTAAGAGTGCLVWEGDPESPNFYHCGAVGDGSHNDTEALQAGVRTGKIHHAGDGDFVVDGATIQASHPYRLTGSGEEKTILRFKNMGGLSGTNGFEFLIDDSTPFMATSFIGRMTIAVDENSGASAFLMPRDQSLVSGDSIWGDKRPSYKFFNIKMRGANRVGSGSSILYDSGWSRYFDIGDSDAPYFEKVSIAGFFNTTLDDTVSPQLEAKESKGWYFGGADDPDGGAVFMPLLHQCDSQNVGYPVIYGRRVSNPRVANSQFHLSGVPISTDDSLANSDSLSEAQFHNLNLNGTYGGVRISRGASFIDLLNVRTTRSSGQFNHGLGWTGVRLVGGGTAMTASLINCRALDAESGAPVGGNRRGFRIEGFDQVNLGAVVVEDRSTGSFLINSEIVDCNNIYVSGVNSKGGIDTQLNIRSTAPSTPSGSISGVSANSDVTDKYLIGSQLDSSGLSFDDYDSAGGVDQSFTTITDAGSEAVNSKRGNQILKRAFGAGVSGAYTYTINMERADSGMGAKQILMIQLNSSAGTDPTVEIVDEWDAATKLTLTGDGSLKKYRVDLVNPDGFGWDILSSSEVNW